MTQAARRKIPANSNRLVCPHKSTISGAITLIAATASASAAVPTTMQDKFLVCKRCATSAKHFGGQRLCGASGEQPGIRTA